MYSDNCEEWTIRYILSKIDKDCPSSRIQQYSESLRNIYRDNDALSVANITKKLYPRTQSTRSPHALKSLIVDNNIVQNTAENDLIRLYNQHMLQYKRLSELVSDSDFTTMENDTNMY